MSFPCNESIIRHPERNMLLPLWDECAAQARCLADGPFLLEYMHHQLFPRNLEDHLGSTEANLHPFAIFQDMAITATLTPGLDIIYLVSVFKDSRIVS
jgi:hypothetical protein